MPFSRSQNSKTARKSAFITQKTARWRRDAANKKAGKTYVSDFRALASPANFTVLASKIIIWSSPVKRKSSA
jgi:hypothetical protein